MKKRIGTGCVISGTHPVRKEEHALKQLTVKHVPEHYKLAAPEDQRGRWIEIAYPVGHYIDSSRQLVAGRTIDEAEAGRKIVRGERITKRCHIYLPAGYDPEDQTRRYNVLYLLHGVGGDHGEWLQGNPAPDGQPLICHILDHLIAEGEIEPLIVVFPNGRSSHDWTDRSFDFAGTSMLGFYYFDYELRYDLIPFIEAHYPTRADISDTSADAVIRNRMHRAIGGLSMGGMQALNLIIGGYRFDSAEHVGKRTGEHPGLEPTVQAPGLLDLFGYVGAFSNAPTSSSGEVLGGRIRTCGHPLHLLYLTCGDADAISYDVYGRSIAGLKEHAGDALGDFCQVVVKGGVHNFDVWNHAAYNFGRLAFRPREQQASNVLRVTVGGSSAE